MNKKQIIAAILLVVAISLGALWWTNSATENSTNNSTSNQTQVSEEVTAQAISSDDGKSVAYDGVADKTALEQLKVVADIETESTSFGEMVVSINDVTAEDTTSYWAFYINDQYANEGAGTYKMKTSDKIEWRLEAIQ